MSQVRKICVVANIGIELDRLDLTGKGAGGSKRIDHPNVHNRLVGSSIYSFVRALFSGAADRRSRFTTWHTLKHDMYQGMHALL